MTDLIKKHIIPTAIIACLAILVLMQGCSSRGCKSDVHANDISDSIPNHNIKAFDLMKAGEPFEVYMEEQLKAVEELRKGNLTFDPVDILTQTGWFYTRHGDYMEALEFLQEASDSISERSKNKGALDISSIRTFGNLANLYCRFGLYDDALRENQRAIQISAQNGYKFISDLWKMRGATYAIMLEDNKNKGVADSCLYCFDMALSTIPLMNVTEELKGFYRDNANMSRATLFVENPVIYRDSLQSAASYLEKYLKDSLPDKNTSNSTEKVLLGRAYCLTGSPEQGFPLMEEGLQEFREQNWTESVDWALDIIAKSIAESGKFTEYSHILPDYIASRDSLINREKLNAVIGADFRYRLREKEKESELLKEENRKSMSIILYETLALLLGVLIGGYIVWATQRRARRAEEEKLSQQRTIDEIMNRQTILNKTIESLNEQITKQKSTKTVENHTANLDPSLLSGEDESAFRKAFVALHPDYLKKLRDEFPALTESDEMLCMMIYLKMPPVDIAMTLGISRASLNSARYRIRKRLNLDKDIDLDEFLRTR